MQIIPNVYLVNGFPYGQHQNSFVVKTDDVTVMIDSGEMSAETDSLKMVRKNCLTWGFDLDEIDYLLVTHAHYDHSSHAARLQRMGVKIVSNQDGAEAMAAGDHRCIPYAIHRPFEPCAVDRIVGDGEELTIGGLNIRCIAAPGHANSCLIYEMDLDDRRLWFVGDVILIGPECQSVELGWGGGPDFDRPTYLRTLQKLCDMHPDCLFAGHGPPCIGHGKRLVEMAYMKAMLEWR
jgi:glyoxylase-like metal-dependent hydrolase (beta-lactamase superfamily II)